MNNPTELKQPIVLKLICGGPGSAIYHILAASRFHRKNVAELSLLTLIHVAGIVKYVGRLLTILADSITFRRITRHEFNTRPLFPVSAHARDENQSQ